MLLLALALPGVAAASAEEPSTVPAADSASTASGIANPPPERPLLSGLVLGDDGAPVPEAKVTIFARSEATGSNGDAAARLEGGKATASTEQDGRFDSADLAGEKFYVCVTADGYAPLVRQKLDPGDHVFPLERGRALTGRVLDLGTGGPIAEIRISLHDAATRFFGASIQRTESDARGVFRIDHVAEGRAEVRYVGDAHAQHSVETIIERHGSSTESAPAPAPDPAPATTRDVPDGREAGRDDEPRTREADEQNAPHGRPTPVSLDDVFLGPGGTLAGRVVGSEADEQAGEPLPRARVDLVPSEARGGRAVRRRAVVDSAGTFAFAGVAAGERYRVVARAPRRAEVEMGPFLVDAGSIIDDILIALGPGAELTVRLVDPDDRPLTDLAISLEKSGDRGLGQVARGRVTFVAKRQIHVNDDDTIRVVSLPPGRFDVVLRPKDAMEIVIPDLRLVDGETEDLGQHEVDPGNHIAGTVIDVDGEPVADARVSVGWRDHARYRLEHTDTDDDGAFSVGGLLDDPVQVIVDTGGFTVLKVEDVEPGRDDLRLVLSRPGSISGTVRLEEGSLASTFSVRAVAAPGEGLESLVRGRVAIPARVESDAESGSFALLDVAAGTYTVEVRSPGFAPGRKGDLEVQADQVTDAGEIVLKTGLELSGRIVDDLDDTAVVGAFLQLDRATGLVVGGDLAPAEAATTSDATGGFELLGLEPGRWILSTEHSSFSPTSLEIALAPGAPPRAIEIRLRSGGSIEGTVHDSDGLPRVGADILLSDPSGALDSKMVSTGPDGNYRIVRLAAGSYMVSLARSGARSMFDLNSKSAVVRDGEITVVDFDEAAGLSLSGFVLRGTEPLPSAQLMFSPAVGADAGTVRGIGSTRADAEGHYEVELEGPGEYNVNVLTGSSTTLRFAGTTTLLVPDEPATVLDVNLGEYGVRGFVVESNGDPVAGAQILAMREGASGEPAQAAGIAESEVNGGFAILGLEPGSYRVTAQAAGFTPSAARSVVVGDDPLAGEMEIVLRRGRQLRGRVVDAHGTPVEGALVVVGAEGIAGAGAVSNATDRLGEFGFQAALDAPMEFTVFGGGLAPGRLRGWIAPVDAGTSHENDPPGPIIVLTDGGSARVLALDADGRPVSGVTLSLNPVEGPNAPPMAPPQSATSDTAGTVVFRRLAPGRYRAVAPSAEGPPVTFDVSEGATAEIVFDVGAASSPPRPATGGA